MQPLVARFNTEAEYHALAHTTSEILWIKSLLDELSIPFLPLTLLCDNLSAMLLSHNHILHARTKHVELDIHFIYERIITKKLKIQHVPSNVQVADTLTKPLGTSTFHELQTKLKVASFKPP